MLFCFVLSLFLFESERRGLFGPSAGWRLDEWMEFAGAFDASQFANDLLVFVEKPSKFIPSVADFILLKYKQTGRRKVITWAQRKQEKWRKNSGSQQGDPARVACHCSISRNFPEIDWWILFFFFFTLFTVKKRSRIEEGSAAHMCVPEKQLGQKLWSRPWPPLNPFRRLYTQFDAIIRFTKEKKDKRSPTGIRAKRDLPDVSSRVYSQHSIVSLCAGQCRGTDNK